MARPKSYLRRRLLGMDPLEDLIEKKDAALKRWEFERIDERQIRVICPYFSTPLDLSVDHHERTHRALFNLAVDALEQRCKPGRGL